MAKLLALVHAIAIGAVVWFGSPLFSEDFAQAWFIGTGDWHTVTIMGREIAGGAVGLVVWILGLHRSAF